MPVDCTLVGIRTYAAQVRWLLNAQPLLIKARIVDIEKNRQSE